MVPRSGSMPSTLNSPLCNTTPLPPFWSIASVQTEQIRLRPLSKASIRADSRAEWAPKRSSSASAVIAAFNRFAVDARRKPYCQIRAVEDRLIVGKVTMHWQFHRRTKTCGSVPTPTCRSGTVQSFSSTPSRDPATQVTPARDSTLVQCDRYRLTVRAKAGKLRVVAAWQVLGFEASQANQVGIRVDRRTATKK